MKKRASSACSAWVYDVKPSEVLEKPAQAALFFYG
jgi:hypothetical protein